MDLLKLTEQAAHTLKSCELLAADAGNEEHQCSLAANLDALRKRPPVSPPVLVLACSSSASPMAIMCSIPSPRSVTRPQPSRATGCVARRTGSTTVWPISISQPRAGQG